MSEKPSTHHTKPEAWIEDPAHAEAEAWARHNEDNTLWMHNQENITLHPSDIKKLHEDANAKAELASEEYLEDNDEAALHEALARTAVTGASFHGREQTIDAPSLKGPENLGQLVAELQSLPEVQHLLEAMRKMVPAEKERSRGWRKKGRVEWKDVVQQEGHPDVPYSYELTYNKDDGELAELEVVGAKERYYKGTKLSLAIQNAGIARIKIEMIEPPTDELNALGRVISTKGYPEALSLEIDLTVDNLGVQIARDYMYHRGMGGDERNDFYTFDAEANEFQGRQVRVMHGETSSTLPPMNTKKFATIVKGALSLIPLKIERQEAMAFSH